MDEPLPGLTEAEHALVTSYRRVLELLTRLDPTRERVTLPGAVRAAEALQPEVAALLAALRALQERGEHELFPETLATVLRATGVDELLARLSTGRG